MRSRQGHTECVPETIENIRRWASYVCPGCRFVFRVPKGAGGQGILCPGCRRTLKIPTATDAVPELTVASTRAADPKAAMVKRQRQMIKPGGSKNTIWDRKTESPLTTSGGNRQMRLLLAGGIFLFLLVTTGVLVSTHSAKPPAAAELAAIPRPTPQAPPPVVERSEASYLAEMEPIARQFMQATTVAEILPLVRNPAVAEPRIRRTYPDGKIVAPGMTLFNTSGMISTHGIVSAVGVMTRDHEEKAIAFVETPQGMKIDWESWAIWSEMPWAQFLSARPTAAHVFRVILSPVVYYNFEYSDDKKWKSYSLESPDREHVIFGYVEKGSEVDRMIHLDPEAKTLSLMLSLKFNPNCTSKNQVEIERLVTEGWVENADTP